jgi:hypothetical protein
MDSVFDRLDEWRHFTGYQLERRADVFFSLYLPEVLEAKLGTPIREELIPEFPLAISAVNAKHSNYRAYRVDFLAVSKDSEDLVLVELKTDNRSRRIGQDKYLTKASDTEPRRIIEGLIKGFKSASQIRKHYCLLEQAEILGLIEIPDALQVHMKQKSLRGLTKLTGTMKIGTPPTKTRIVYIQPLPSIDSIDALTITFDEIADIVARHSDPLSQRFAKSLRKWTNEVPGNPQRQ